LGLFAPNKLPIQNGQNEFLELIGYQLGAALQVKELSDLMKNSNGTEEAAYDETVRALVKILDLRDSETEEHTLRVANLAVRLARNFGISNYDLLRVRRGALLHDIGKIAISDKILLKPAPLSKHEWEIMRQHPEIALELLSQFPFLQDALDIPIAHHERWDGRGYPRGLSKEDIPLIARIFAVVDVWDALSSDRPYRRAWPESDVLAYIVSESGKQFDPEVVEAFMEVIGGYPQRVFLPEFELLT
jgi:putative nucleotidyltransferase with HDIG domain